MKYGTKGFYPKSHTFYHRVHIYFFKIFYQIDPLKLNQILYIRVSLHKSWRTTRKHFWFFVICLVRFIYVCLPIRDTHTYICCWYCYHRFPILSVRGIDTSTTPHQRTANVARLLGNLTTTLCKFTIFNKIMLNVWIY